MTTERTERSSSKASRSSFEAYERRVLHLSKLSITLFRQNNISIRKKQPIEKKLKIKYTEKII